MSESGSLQMPHSRSCAFSVATSAIEDAAAELAVAEPGAGTAAEPVAFLRLREAAFVAGAASVGGVAAVFFFFIFVAMRFTDAPRFSYGSHVSWLAE